MEIIKINKNNYQAVIRKSVEVLKQGGLIIFPSDTVYGLLVDATNEQAVNKLIKFKNRPPGKAISVFVSDFKMMKDIVIMEKSQEKILNQVLPGSFTIILKSKNGVSQLLESEKRTLGVRIPDYRYIQILINKFGKPTTATSANLASRPPHYSIATLLKELSKEKQTLIDLVVDAGQLPRNKPSTVIDLTESEIKILRQGEKNFINNKTYISKSPLETKRIAKKLLTEIKEQIKPMVFIIEGELGVGKTIFVKGLGESQGIDNIVSPTYVIYYEYGNFYHFDLYQVEEKQELNNLGINKLLKTGNILCCEWGERSGEVYNLLKEKGKVIYIKMKYLDEKKREIVVSY